MFDDRHTVLPQATRPETDIQPVDVGKAGDLRDAQSLPRGSTGLRTRRNWYVAAAAGAILVGTGVWSFGAHMAMPERGTVPPPPPSQPWRSRFGKTSRTELSSRDSFPL